MFYVKNDDMEDMMRKAADNYELNEDMAADWSKVRAALQDEDASFTSTKKEKKRRKLYLFWWLLLIPAIAIFTYEVGLYDSDKKQNIKTTITKKPNSPAQSNLSGNNSTISGNNSTSSQSNTNAKNIAITNSKKTATNNKIISVEMQSSLSTNEGVSAKKTSTASRYTDANKNILSKQTLVQSAPLADNSNQADSSFKNNLTNDQLSNKATEVLNNKTDVNQKDNKTDIAHTNTSVQKKKTDNYTRQAFAYTGLTGNADISFIKFQKASSPGIGIGIVGGYHFKSGISVETGILYDKKSYYTKGEYFDKGKLAYLQNVNLISADGNCHMWEIPLNFKYDFNAQKKHNWFVTGGISSYIMNKEYYNFKYENYGVINEKAYDFYHSSQNWFSILNIGGGINIKTGNKYFLQAQPYYKIPLSGIGKGSLSLNSTGINLSVIRRLH